MKKPGKRELWQAASCWACVILVWRELEFLGPSEFSGGYVSGRLFRLAETACLLFAFGLILTFVFRRAAAALLIAASLFCWPLYLYLTFPGVIRRVTGGEYSAPLAVNVIWDG